MNISNSNSRWKPWGVFSVNEKDLSNLAEEIVTKHLDDIFDFVEYDYSANSYHIYDNGESVFFKTKEEVKKFFINKFIKSFLKIHHSNIISL
jgi:hypothetical protein